jgi:hypothetical protein
MLPVSLDCFCFVQTKQKQSRETGNIGYTRQRQTKQKQSRETGNIGYTRQSVYQQYLQDPHYLSLTFEDDDCEMKHYSLAIY